MHRGTPAFADRCKVRPNPVRMRPTKVSTLMPKRMLLVSIALPQPPSSACPPYPNLAIIHIGRASGRRAPRSRASEGCRRAFSQVSPGDLDVAVLSQLTLTEFALGNPFKACALEVIGFKTALGCRPIR